MNKLSLITKVRAIMNEAGADEQLDMLSEDLVKLDVYIEAVISDAMRLVIQLAPIHLLNATSGTPVVTEVAGGGVLLLPKGFLRFVAMKLTGWKRTVFAAHPQGSEAYLRQQNPVTRSGACKPVCVFTHIPGGAAIAGYPYGAIDFFSYIQAPSGDIEAELSRLNPELIPALCYLCASLVYTIFEMPAPSDRMKQTAVELMPKE